MADFNNAIMTIGGVALLAATAAGTARLKFVKLVTGSGSYTESEKNRGNLQACTGLKAPMQEIPFSSISMASETCVKLVALVSNATLKVGYYVSEVGIYAINEMDTAAEPILYSIAIANVADYLPPYNGLAPATITQEYFATVDNALEVTIQTNTEAVALATDLDALSKKVENMLDKVFQSGNEKKQKLVENLVAMGIDSSTKETWESLIDKVLEMTNTSEDTVTAAAMLEGYTAHNAAGELVIGIIPELAAVTVDATNVTQDSDYTYFEMPEGHYNVQSKVRSANSNLSSDLVVSNMTNASSFDVTFPKLPETVYACAVYSVGGALMYFWEYNCATGITRYKYSDSMNEWRPSTNSPLTVNGNTVTYKKIGADFGAAIVFG